MKKNGLEKLAEIFDTHIITHHTSLFQILGDVMWQHTNTPHSLFWFVYLCFCGKKQVQPVNMNNSWYRKSF